MAVASSASQTPRAVLLHLDRRTIEELKLSAKTTNSPQLCSGPKPRLRINGITRDLKIASTANTDLYTYSIRPYSTKKATSVSDPKHELVNWTRVGTIQNRIELKRDSTNPAVDAASEAVALAVLKESLASLEKEKQANSTHIASGVISNSRKQLNHGRGRDLTNRKLNSKALHDATHNFTNLGDRSKRGPLSTTGSSDAGVADACKKVLVHCLALEPATIVELRKKTCIASEHLEETLKKIATEAREVNQAWELNDKAYRELDVWNFRYKTEADRARAIENAVRAYDRSRLPKDHKTWQLLLPPAERNKGICLSRLTLNHHSQHSSAATPLVGETAPDKQVASAAPTPRLGVSPRPASSKSSTVNKRSFPTDPVKAKKDRQIAEAKEQKRKEKEAAKQKAPQTSPQKTSTRPLVPSPLGARPRVASDVSERIARPTNVPSKPGASVTTTTSAPSEAPRKPVVNNAAKPKPSATIAKPTTSVKRKAAETAPAARVPVKHRKTDSVSSQSAKSTSSTNPNSTAHTSPDMTFDSGGNSDSSSSIVEGLTYTQGVVLAEKFRDQYYPAYAKMYDEQAAKEDRGERVDKEDRERLWAMHRRLEQMKKQIESASRRARQDD